MKLIVITFAALLLSQAGVAFAQQAPSEPSDNSPVEELEKWYQVELLIYSTTNSDLSGSELWPMNPDLRYPSTVQRLYPLADTPNNKTIDSIDDIVGPINNTGTESNFSPIIQTEFNTEPVEEQPFYLLDSSEHQLTNAAKKLAKKPNVKILFHESWRQPLVNREQASSILIQGGDQFDQHFELEGSIKLSVERYIHINTDLWLSSFANKLAVEDNPWGALPMPPAADTKNNLDPLLPVQLDHQYQSPFQYLFANNYSVLRTVVMRQHRRMRSKELHYIDHPLMGVLVRIVPYERVIPEKIIEEGLIEEAVSPQLEKLESQ